MATSLSTQSETSIQKSLSELESDLASKERQFLLQYGKEDTDLDISKHLKTVTSSPLTIAASTLKFDMRNRLQLEQKRKKDEKNHCLITETKPMAIPSEISDDKSLINSIKALDSVSSTLPLPRDNPSLSQMHRADVLIESSDDAWVYSLDPLKNLVLPKKRIDIQTTCRICNAEVKTNTAPTTDYLLCEKHQENLEKLAKTIETIYGSLSKVQPPTERPQFHLNLYGPVLNRLNIFIQQLKTKATESDQNMKNIYEIMIDTNTMFKASFVLYERYLNPINMELFFLIIMNVFDFVAAHQARIIEGLNGIEKITTRILEVCLLLVTRLLVLVRVVIQAFFGFFSIQLNVIYKNIIANMVWDGVAQYLVGIIARILIGVVVTVVILGIVYLTYKLYQWATKPSAINADIDKDELIVT
jgi:hypothetical protein